MLLKLFGTFALLISRDLRKGHTPRPIVVIAYGPGQDLFNGYEDNTQFAKKLFKLMK